MKNGFYWKLKLKNCLHIQKRIFIIFRIKKLLPTTVLLFNPHYLTKNGSLLKQISRFSIDTFKK